MSFKILIRLVNLLLDGDTMQPEWKVFILADSWHWCMYLCGSGYLHAKQRWKKQKWANRAVQCQILRNLCNVHVTLTFQKIFFLSKKVCLTWAAGICVCAVVFFVSGIFFYRLLLNDDYSFDTLLSFLLIKLRSVKLLSLENYFY